MCECVSARVCVCVISKPFATYASNVAREQGGGGRQRHLGEGHTVKLSCKQNWFAAAEGSGRGQRQRQRRPLATSNSRRGDFTRANRRDNAFDRTSDSQYKRTAVWPNNRTGAQRTQAAPADRQQQQQWESTTSRERKRNKPARESESNVCQSERRRDAASAV